MMPIILFIVVSAGLIFVQFLILNKIVRLRMAILDSAKWGEDVDIIKEKNQANYRSVTGEYKLGCLECEFSHKYDDCASKFGGDGFCSKLNKTVCIGFTCNLFQKGGKD